MCFENRFASQIESVFGVARRSKQANPLDSSMETDTGTPKTGRSDGKLEFQNTFLTLGVLINTTDDRALQG